MREGLDTEPEAEVIDWNSEVLQRRVTKEESEDVEYVVAVVGEGIGVYDGVEVDCEETGSGENDRL